MHLDCTPVLDYGRRHVEWEYDGRRLPRRRRPRRGRRPRSCTLTTDLRLGLRGRARPRAHDAARRRHGVRRAVVDRARRPRDLRRGLPRASSARPTSGTSGSRTASSPTTRGAAHLQRSALTLKGLTYAPTGAIMRRGDDLAARDAGRRAQLGLPLLVDPRLDVRAVGPLHARLRLGGQRLLLLHPRRRRGRGRPADHVRHRRRDELDRARRSTTSTATRAPGRCGSATAPTTSSSTTSGARCSTRSTCTRSRATSCPSRCGRSLAQARSRTRSSTGASPTAASGRSAASRSHFTSLEGHVLGRLRPRRAPGAAARGRTSAPSAGRRAADEIHADVCANAASTARACSRSTTTPTRSTRRCLLMPLVRFLPADDAADRRDGRRRSPTSSPIDGLVLRYRVEETDDGLSGEEGTFAICSFWLVSALAEIGETTRAPAAVREDARVRDAPCCSTPRRSTRARAATSATSPRPSPTWR